MKTVLERYLFFYNWSLYVCIGNILEVEQSFLNHEVCFPRKVESTISAGHLPSEKIQGVHMDM